MKIYSIKDNKIGFTQLFVAQNSFAALRIFTEVANDKSSYVNKFSNDFALYELGDLDENSGTIKSEVKFIEEATNLIRKE